MELHVCHTHKELPLHGQLVYIIYMYVDLANRLFTHSGDSPAVVIATELTI